MNGKNLTCVLLGTLASFCPSAGESADDGAGLRLAQRVEAALTGGQDLHDAVLQGEYGLDINIVGDAKFTGPITLEFSGTRRSLVHAVSASFLALPGAELCTVNAQGEIIGAWVDSAATTYSPGHGSYTNCWSAPVWFFPATLLSMVHEKGSTVTHQGRDGSDEVLRLYKAVAGPSAGLWRNLTTLEFHINPTTALPDSITLWRGGFLSDAVLPLPPSDPLAASNVPETIHYSDYRKVSGVLVPFKVEWSVPAAGLTMPIRINSVTINGGVSLGDFELPASVRSEVDLHKP